MATHIGRDGIIKVGGTSTKNDGTVLGELRSFSIEETADTVEYSAMGSTARVFLPTLTSFTGSADAYWDETDGGQTALAIGSQITIKFFPEGDAVADAGPPAVAADTMYEGNAIVTGITRNASFDGMVEASITFQGSGALTAYDSVAP
jgi:predicted secreted protein